MDVHLELLRTFVIAATSRTFGEAARVRRVTTSAISQQVKTLEAQLGVPLFERVGRQVALTPTGERLLETVKGELSRLEQALEVAVGEHREVKGRVAIGSPRPFAAHWLRPRLPDLIARHPQLELEIDFDVPSVLERRLATGELDFAILVREAEHPGLESRTIHVETFVAVAEKKLARDADGIIGLPFAAFDRDLPMHEAWFRAVLGPRSGKRPRIVCYVASLDELRALAISGACAAVLPDYFVATAIREGKLVALDAGEKRKPAKNEVHLAWRKNAVRSARFVAVRDALLPA